MKNYQELKQEQENFDTRTKNNNDSGKGGKLMFFIGIIVGLAIFGSTFLIFCNNHNHNIDITQSVSSAPAPNQNSIPFDSAQLGQPTQSEMDTSHSYIVMITQDGTDEELRAKNEELIKVVKEEYHGDVTAVYDSVFFGFAYNIPSNDDGFKADEANSVAFLNSVTGVSVEQDQIVHAL